MKRAASAAQLPTTAGGAIDERRAVAGGAGEVGEHGRRLAEAHVEGEAAAELDGVEEAEPGERLGLVAAQLAVEALGRGDRLGRRPPWPCSSRSVGPARCPRRVMPPAERRCPRGRRRGAGSRRR